jgi:hypothetical protein
MPLKANLNLDAIRLQQVLNANTGTGVTSNPEVTQSSRYVALL